MMRKSGTVGCRKLFLLTLILLGACTQKPAVNPEICLVNDTIFVAIAEKGGVICREIDIFIDGDEYFSLSGSPPVKQYDKLLLYKAALSDYRTEDGIKFAKPIYNQVPDLIVIDLEQSSDEQTFMQYWSETDSMTILIGHLRDLTGSEFGRMYWRMQPSWYIDS